MNIKDRDSVLVFWNELLVRLENNSNVHSTYDWFMYERFNSEVWMSETFRGSMFEYTGVIMIEEITEVYSEFKNGGTVHLIDELGDLYGVYEALRMSLELKRVPWTPIDTVIDPLSVIKRITKMVRFRFDKQWYIRNCMDSVGEFIRSVISLPYFDYPHIKASNISYFIMVSSFIKGLRRLYIKFNMIQDLRLDLLIKMYNSNLTAHSKLSKVAMNDLEYLERYLINGK